MIWRNLWAWTGLLLLALPVLIHLLSRAPADVRPFPSLRFVDPSRLSPRRRTRPRDVLLLLVRLGILVAAVAALAGPVFLTARRTATPRVVRAIVLDTSASMQQQLDSATALAASGRDGAELHTLVRTADLHAGIGGAVGWLGVHPGVRELVVISDFQRGSVDSSALRGVPDAYGVRFVRVAGSAPPDTFAMEGNGTGVRVRALADRTEMSWQRVNGATGPAVPGFQLRASASSRTRALAAYAAAMEVVGAPRADLASAGTGVSSLDRLAPNSGGITAADALVQIVYADAQGDTIRSSVLGAGVAPLTSAWMADVVVRIAADPLLREVAREGVRIDGMRPAAAISRITGTTADTTRFVVVTTSSGEPLVQAAQDSSGGTSRLLLFCLADAGSAVSTALIAATSRALESSGGDSATSVGGVSHAASMHDMTEREPLMMPDAELQRFNRVPADSAASATAVLSAMDAEQGSVSDARWFWGLALLLMAVEALMRRGGGNA